MRRLASTDRSWLQRGHVDLGLNRAYKKLLAVKALANMLMGTSMFIVNGLVNVFIIKLNVIHCIFTRLKYIITTYLLLGIYYIQ